MFANDTGRKGLGASLALSSLVHFAVLLLLLLHINERRNYTDSYLLTEISMIEISGPKTAVLPVEMPEIRKNIFSRILPVRQSGAVITEPLRVLKTSLPEGAKQSGPPVLLNKSKPEDAGFSKQISLENEIGRKIITPVLSSGKTSLSSDFREKSSPANIKALSMTAKTAGLTAHSAGAVSLNGKSTSSSPLIKTVQPVSTPSPGKTTTQNRITAASRKKLEIYGDAAARKLLHSQPPAYPRWAQAEGAKAVVTLSFTLMPDGTVRDNVSIESVTGQRDLAQYAVDAMKKFRFVKSEDKKEQKGFAVFRFELE